MKKVLQSMSKLVAGLFSIAVLALLMSLTYGALQRLFPDNFGNQMWGLVMFDIAAMCWALIFVFQSRSVGQYAAAGLGFVVAFVGTLGMVAAEVMLSGTTLTPEQIAQIAKWMTYGFIAVTAIHAALVYTHHGTAPEIHEQINVGAARAEVIDQAITNATKTIEAQKMELGHAIYQDIVSQVKRDLNMYPIDGTPFDRRQDRQFNLETEDMPIEEWAALEDELKQKGYLKRSNLPRAKRTSAPREDRPLSVRFRDWVNSLKQQPGAPAQEPQPEPISDFVRQHMWDPNDPNDSPYASHHPWTDEHPRQEDAKPAPAGSNRPLYNEHTYYQKPKAEDAKHAPDDPFPGSDESSH